MTSTVGIERASTQSPHAGDKMRIRLRPLAALAIIAMVALITAAVRMHPPGPAPAAAAAATRTPPTMPRR
jgi:hypothetical protein